MLLCSFGFAIKKKVTPVAPRNVNDLPRVGTFKHECRISIVSSMPWVAPRDVDDMSCVGTIKHAFAVPLRFASHGLLRAM